MNINKDTLKTAIQNYNTFDEESRQKIDVKNQQLCREAFNEFLDACCLDKSIIESVDEICNLEQILKFDRKSYFTIITDQVFDEYDGCIHTERTYSPQLEAEARDAAENWKSISAGINQEIKLTTSHIDKLKSSDFTLFKKLKLKKANSKLTKLNDDLRRSGNLRDLYLSVEANEQKYHDCISNGGPEQKKKLQDAVHEKKLEIAHKILEKHINDNPCIICAKRDHFKKSITRGNIHVEGEVLGQIIIDLFAELSIQIEQEQNEVLQEA